MKTSRSIPPSHPASILKESGVRPKKSLGQNFLLSSGVLEKIAAAAEISSQDEVLEVGPGLGSLTRVLALKARRVVAVELDDRLIPILQESLADLGNITLVHADILETRPAELMESPGYIVAANIPYYITSALIRHLLESDCPPARLALTVQREVAERICAAPGDMSLLALGVQVYGTARNVLRIPAGAFTPAPRVDSAVVRIDLYPQPRVPRASLETFFALARAAFSQKRKTLRNSLASGMGWKSERTAALLESAGVDPQRRAETLSVEEWRSIVEKTG